MKMFRGSMEGQTYFAPRVLNGNPATWPNDRNCGDSFWGFVAHAYKGYHYYTGSDFPADKPSVARFARTDEFLLVHVWMEDEVMAEAVEHCKTQGGGFDMADHVTVNILTPMVSRYRFSVNPVGMRKTEKNLDRNAALPFDATVHVHPSAWEVLFRIPFATLECDPQNTAALALDVVRQEQGDSAITTLTRAVSTPPYNFLYEYPVFHFSRLLLNDRHALPEALFEDACQGVQVVVREETPVGVGGFCEIVLTLTVGSRGLASGGRIKLCHAAPVLDCGVLWTLPQDWQNVQTERPTSAGYLSVRGAAFDVETNGVYTTCTHAGKTSLPPGSRIEIRIGDRSHGGPGIRAPVVSTSRHAIALNMDARANGLTEPLLPWPEVSIRPDEAAEIILSNPGAVPPGSSFELCVRLVDRFGNLAETFTGMVSLFLDADDHTFPDHVEFRPADRGAMLVEGAIRSRGIYAFAATSGRLTGQGNYLATDGSFGEGYILYGDIHCHTCLSDGWRTPEDKVFENRFLRGLNFMAIADHDFDMTPAKWSHFKRLARQSDLPGRFACFLAHEWTPSAGHGKPFKRQRPGHYVIVYPAFEGDLFRANARQARSPAQLFKAAKCHPGVMVIPHYHGRRPPIDADLSCALEIISWDGKISETERDAVDSVFTTLNAGWKLGIIAGTDHGGEGFRIHRNGEMFSVRSPTMERDAIRGSMKRRQTVALSHSRVLLCWTLNGAEMGAELMVGREEPRNIRVRVASRPYALSIQLIRNGEAIATFSNSGRSGSHEIVACSFTDLDPLEKECWYLIRLVLHGGEKIWSSPIWVRPLAVSNR